MRGEFISNSAHKSPRDARLSAAAGPRHQRLTEAEQPCQLARDLGGLEGDLLVRDDAVLRIGEGADEPVAVLGDFVSHTEHKAPGNVGSPPALVLTQPATTTRYWLPAAM
jgi:hypothetical protein